MLEVRILPRDLAEQIQDVGFSQEITIVTAATLLGVRHFREFGNTKTALDATYKPEGSPQSNIDISTGAVITAHLREGLDPQIYVVEEESSSCLPGVATEENDEIVSETDPLDGSVNLLRGLQEVTTGTAIRRGNNRYAGVVFDHSTNELLLAEEEIGTYLIPIDDTFQPLNEKPQRQVASDKEIFDQSIVYIDGYSNHKTRGPLIEMIGTLDKLPDARTVHLRADGSSIHHQMQIAKGKADLMFMLAKGGPWDFAGIPHMLGAGAVCFDAKTGESAITEETEAIVAGAPVLVEKILPHTIIFLSDFTGHK